jgi:hypothetical protein
LYASFKIIWSLGGLFVRELLAAAVKSIIYVAQFGLPLKSQGLCYESPLIGGVFDAGEKSAIEWHRVDFQFTACPLICRHRDQAKFCLY